ncbi:MAG TPA: cation:proton antiporter [Candidatus Dormibacteraeota bacterium]|jgi:CPA2 family monovalent cation:H+ antiporter-2|nr:cation:proton antiporter [Candidatus Dormibacteraeota bacterium]
MESTAPAVFDVGFVLLLAAVGGWLARRVGLPAVLGYLAVGLVVSPFTPGYVADRHQLELFADVGVVLLLFEVGIEIDPLEIGRERGRLFLVAPIQVVLSTLVAGGLGLAAGLRPAGALLLGLCVALSSSVVVVNITRSRRRTTDAATDQVLLGWSVVQDMVGVALAIVAVIALGLQARSGPIALALTLLYLAIVVIAAALLPRLLRAMRNEHDLFLVFTIASALALAGIGSVVFGIPLALAAFVSGLAITESREAAEARQRLLPFRDLFAVLFFVAIGALVDPTALLKGLGWLGLLLGLLIVAKLIPVYALARFVRVSARPLQVGIGLAQIGEFSFVLATIGLAHNLLPRELYAAILASVVITIAASTVLVRVGFNVDARRLPRPAG